MDRAGRRARHVFLAAAAVIIVTGCSAGHVEPEPHAGTSRASDPSPLSDTQRRAMADGLRSELPCAEADTWFDDMSFWDAMRGFDCFDPAGTSFVRVYRHAPSVPQVLQDWNGTLGSDRALAFGAHWFVIGPRAVIEDVRRPTREPRTTASRTPTALTSAEDYLTTCVRYGASEGERFVRDPDGHDPDDEQYAVLFPGVTKTIHSAVRALGPERIEEHIDDDRWLAALSSTGPAIKGACREAARAAQSAGRSTGGPDARR